MKHLIHIQRRFPIDFLFIPGSRLDEDGYRWSPSSWLSYMKGRKKFISLPFLNGTVKIQESTNVAEGLYCNCRAFRLQHPWQYLQHHSFAFSLPRIQQWFLVDVYPSQPQEEPCGAGKHMQVSTLDSPAILLREDFDLDDASGAVVNITGTSSQGRLFARYYCFAEIRPVTDFQDLEFLSSDASTPFTLKGYDINTNQAWCIY